METNADDDADDYEKQLMQMANCRLVEKLNKVDKLMELVCQSAVPELAQKLIEERSKINTPTKPVKPTTNNDISTHDATSTNVTACEHPQAPEIPGTASGLARKEVLIMGGEGLVRKPVDDADSDQTPKENDKPRLQQE